MLLGFLLSVVGTSVLMGLVWWFFGRDDLPEREVQPTFPPPFPAWAAGVLVDERLDGVDWLAMILQLVQKGALRLKRVGNTLQVVCVPDHAPEEPVEAAFYRFVCERSPLPLDRPLPQGELLPVAQVVYEDLTREGFFAHNPWRVRRLYRDLGNILVLAGVLGGLVGVLYGIVPVWLGFSLGLVPAGLIVRVVGEHMPRKTARGSEAVEMLHALQRMLRSPELPGKPEEILPYALVLGMLGDVVERLTEPPAWWPGKGNDQDELTLDFPLLARNLPSYG